MACAHKRSKFDGSFHHHHRIIHSSTRVVLLLICAFSSFQSRVPVLVSGQLAMDAFLDNILKAVIAQKGHLIDPYALDPIDLPFKQKIGPIRISGFAKLDQISLSGLTTLKRTGAATQITANDGSGDKITTVRMAVGPLTFTSSGKIKFAGISTTKKFLGKISFMEFETTLKAIKSNQKIEVESYDIIQMRDLSMRATGLNDRTGPSSAILNTVIRLTMRLFRKRIRDGTEKALTTIIAEKINDLPPNVKMIMGG